MSTPGPLSISHHFDGLKDPRVSRGRRHGLSDLLVIALCASLADCDSFYEIEDFARDKIDWLRSLGLALPDGPPSHDTFNRVLSALDPVAFQDCFTGWVNAVCAGLSISGYQVDGKAHRGSADRPSGAGPLHTVSVWADQLSLCLGQRAVDGKSNEITAIPPLLRALELQGALVSIDAMGCQKEIAAVVLGQGGDYLLQLKGNQPTLLADARRLLQEAVDGPAAQVSLCQTEDDGHGRQERRTYVLMTDLDGLSTRAEWDGLKAVLAVVRERSAGGKGSAEVSYYISSRADLPSLAAGARSHWGVENRLHWSLDVAFGEDRSRAREGAVQENLGWLRRVALSLLRQEPGKDSIRRKRKRAARDNSFLEKLLVSLSKK